MDFKIRVFLHLQCLRWAANHYFGEAQKLRKIIARSGLDRAAVKRAYDAPFAEGGRSKAGARRFPWCLPFGEPEAGNAADQARCFEALKSWAKPAHFIFGERDPIFTTGWARQWSALLPNATLDLIPDASHFVQEEAGEEIVAAFLERTRST